MEITLEHPVESEAEPTVAGPTTTKKSRNRLARVAAVLVAVGLGYGAKSILIPHTPPRPVLPHLNTTNLIPTAPSVSPVSNPSIPVSTVPVTNGYQGSNTYQGSYATNSSNPVCCTTTLPGSTSNAGDGSWTDSSGAVHHPDGSIDYLDGSHQAADGTMYNADGTVQTPDGSTTNTDGSVTNPDGTVTSPDGMNTVEPDGAGGYYPSDSSSSGSTDTSSSSDYTSGSSDYTPAPAPAPAPEPVESSDG